jgi:hypothetical protein
MKENEMGPAPLIAQKAFKINNIVYVPHYRNESVYVGPGYPKQNMNIYSASELITKGAVQVTALLWSRGAHGLINERNP